MDFARVRLNDSGRSGRAEGGDFFAPRLEKQSQGRTANAK